MTNANSLPHHSVRGVFFATGVDDGSADRGDAGQLPRTTPPLPFARNGSRSDGEDLGAAAARRAARHKTLELLVCNDGTRARQQTRGAEAAAGLRLN